MLHNLRCTLAEKDLTATVPDFNKLPVLTQVLSIDKAARKISAKRVWEEESKVAVTPPAPEA